MREGPVLFILCIVLVGGIGWWAQSGHPFAFFQTQSLRIEPIETSVQAASTPEVAKPKATPAKPRVRTAPVPVPPVEPAVETPAVAAPEPKTEIAELAAPKFEFPEAQQIETGLVRAKITERFGAPSLLTTSSADGHFLETLIYSKAGGDNVTVIRLMDGRVLSAFSR